MAWEGKGDGVREKGNSRPEEGNQGTELGDDRTELILGYSFTTKN